MKKIIFTIILLFAALPQAFAESPINEAFKGICNIVSGKLITTSKERMDAVWATDNKFHINAGQIWKADFKNASDFKKIMDEIEACTSSIPQSLLTVTARNPWGQLWFYSTSTENPEILLIFGNANQSIQVWCGSMTNEQYQRFVMGSITMTYYGFTIVEMPEFEYQYYR